MLIALALGLFGSLGHCVGMCSPIAMLLRTRGYAETKRHLITIHIGRITTYTLLGLAASLLGQSLPALLPNVRAVQGALAVTAALIAGYFALALLGRLPSPEVYLLGAARRWRRAMQRATRPTRTAPHLAHRFTLGMLWGLLPCGLVWTALVTAVAAGTTSVWAGALAMAAFGLGTLPALLGVDWITRRGVRGSRAGAWSRQVAAAVIVLFAVQMGLRGVAAWGWIDHLRLGQVMLW